MGKIKELILEVLANDTVERSLKTFVQAFIAVLIAGYATVDSLEAGKALLVGALAAGVSATWNGLRVKK